MNRILYECLDFQVPAGGIRRLYRHVEVLSAAGFQASILHHTPGFKIEWFDSTAPVMYWDKGFVFDASDVLVIPEGHTNVMRDTRGFPCRRVVIALNWARIFGSLRIGVDWRSFDIKHVIAGSLYEKKFISETMGLESTAIVSGIDLDVFRPSPHKQCAIAFMPRKDTEYFHLIASIFRARCPQYIDVPFIPLENVSHDQVAKTLSTSGLFLANTFPEGLSRKTLEAMASGCLVVGFAGKGSLECMDHLVNCYLAADADALQAAEYLEAAVQSFKSGGSLEMQRAARKTAKKYSLTQEQVNVIAFWNKFMAQP